MSDALDTLAELLNADLKLRCKANAFFADNGITVIARDDESVDDAVLTALSLATPENGKFGACLLLEQPSLTDKMAGLQAGPMTLNGEAVAIEYRLFNADTANGGTGQRALSIARHFALIIKHYNAGGLAHGFIVDSITRTSAGAKIGADEVGLVAWVVKYHALEGDTVVYNKVGNPGITASPALTGDFPAKFGSTGATVTLTPPAGAAAYYTTDLSYPCPPALNPNATLYTVPFVAAAGVLRVGCSEAGKIDSNVFAVKFS